MRTHPGSAARSLQRTLSLDGSGTPNTLTRMTVAMMTALMAAATWYERELSSAKISEVSVSTPTATMSPTIM